jgi:hypothetical protein
MERLGQGAQVVDILGTEVTHRSIHPFTVCYSESVTTLNSKFWLHKELLKAMMTNPPFS